jgi:phosphate transport system permease protein
MTDISIAPPRTATRRHDVTSPAAVALVKRRYRSEARFRMYGLLALVLTSIFVVAVLVDIVRRGLPAFWQHSAVLDVQLDPAAIDPKGERNPADIRAGDYFTLARNAIFAAVPGVEGRVPRKKLADLLSSGAPDDLRQYVMDNPGQIGQSAKVRMLLSDDADLFLKGSETNVVTTPSRGVATPSGTSGDITILTSANDFADDLQLVKSALAGTLDDMRTNLRRLTRGGADYADEAAAVTAEIAAIEERIRQPDVTEQLSTKLPSVLVALNGGLVKLTELSNSQAKGQVILPMTSAAEAQPGAWSVIVYETPEGARKLSDLEIAYLEKLKADGKLENHFNVRFFTAGDSREAELAGILGSLVGSILMLSVTLVLCVPIGVLAAVYLEEFAPKNWFTDIIEININNLAAVPSIVFGLLGLAVFLNFFGLPRSAPLVGGLVLALLVLPTIIIASRAAIKAVPPSIKEAALGVGASHQQAVFHHVLPLAMPGIMTGTIIGMAHALGETAPLLMIGMLAFIVDVPSGFTDSATALPAQIFLWSDLPEQAFKAKTAAAIIVLLMVLFAMNGAAIWLRKKFERRW